MAGKTAIDYAKMPELLANIQHNRTRALVAMQYALAARVSEVVMLKKEDFVDREKYFEVRVINRKAKNIPEKYGIILKEKEQWLIGIIQSWLAVCIGERVFNICESRARQLIRKETGYSSHYFRHSRATHLVQEFNYDAFDLMTALGHSNLDTVKEYVHKKTIDRAMKMLN